MRRSFLIHAGVALVAGSALILLAVLTWVPGLVPPRWASGLPFLTGLLGFPLLLSAFVRLLLARADRTTQWEAFRCLPGVVQLGVAGLAVAGVAVWVLGPGGPHGHLQAPEERGEGRYVALDTSLAVRETVPVSRETYLAVVAADTRAWLGSTGLLLTGAGALVLVAGEVRRADQAGVSEQASRTG